ncbi:hypothetical protein FRB90_002633 [Tulasnella sp. 427]|nr:hypothetical protein FRB90_002633 [Tulasnella sp. 427]
MAIQPTPPITSTTALDKEGLSKLKRPEIQALCKACFDPEHSANNLRAIGTTGSLIDSLSSYFESLALSKPDKNAHVTSKPVSRLRKVLSPKPPFRTAQDPPPPPPVPEPTVLPNGTAVKSKPSLESLSAKPGVRKPSLRIPPTRSRLSSSASLTPMVIETSVEACTADEPSALPDPLFLSPASAAPTPRSVVSPTPSNRSLSSSVRPVRKLGDSTNTKPRTIVTTSKTTAKTTSTQSFPTSNLSNSTSTKPSSAPIRRSSLTPSITSQARSPPLTRPRLSSHASPGPSPIRNMQTEVAELAASLKAVEDARVDQIAALTERIAAQDLALQAQNDLVNALQQTALLRTPPAYGDEGEEDDDPDPQSPVDEDGQDERTMRLDTHLLEHREEESSEDERVTPPVQPRPTRTSTTKRIGPSLPTATIASTTTRTLPSILVNNEKPAENSNSSSLASVLSDGAVSVSISDLDVAGGMTTDDDGGMKRRSPQVHELHDSLLHQPQPSFGGLTTDDEFDDGAEDEMSHTVILSTVPLVRKKSFRT